MIYIKGLKENKIYFEDEIIDEKIAYNEYVLTRLRTIWGIDKNYISQNFNDKIVAHFSLELDKYLNSSYLETDNNNIKLTPEGVFIADKISSDLFFV